MKVFLTIAAAFLAKEASAEAHYGLPHLVPSYGVYGPVVRPQVVPYGHGGIFGRRSHPVLRPVLPFHPIGKREAEPETDSAFTYTVMAHHPKDQEMTNNRYTLLSRMDSHRRMQQRQRQQQLMDESNMQQMDRHMQYRIMDQDQMMQQQQQQRMGLNQQQQIVNNMLDNRRDDPQQRRMLQYSMDNNQMMMHRDNVHDMSDMRVMGMQQQQGLQTNLNRLDMNNQRMRMNNRQQMQQYRLDNDLNQMQRMENNLHSLDNNMMRMMTKREAEGEADGEAGYGYQTYSETPFHKSFAGAYYTNDISPIHPVPAVPAVHPVPAVPAVHPVPAVPAVFNRGYSMYSAPGVFVGHPHPAMGHPIMPFY